MGFKMFRLLLYILAMAAILTLTTMPIPALAGGAQIELEPSDGPVGTKIRVVGEGFETKTEVVISFKTKDNIVQTSYTDEEGCFDIRFTLEECPVGIHWVWASWASGGTSKEVSSYFTVEPKITLNKRFAYVGDEISASGTGFAAEKDITIYFDDEKVGSGKTDANGSFSATLQILKSYDGKVTTKAEDVEHNSASASFSIEQLISFNPKSGPTSTKVTISGTGFGTEKVITIYFDDEKIGESKTNAAGTFTDPTFHIPRSYNGEHTIKVADTDNNSDSASFSTMQSINLNPKSGSVGVLR